MIGQDIASKLNMSARSLQHKLDQQGMTFRDVVDETRLSLALAYLDGGRESVNEIAYNLGFANISNFDRAFRRWTGRSPKSYRR